MVRAATASDVGALVQLTRTLDLSAGTYTRGAADPSVVHLARRFEEIIAEGQRTVLVAVDDAGGLTGLLVARRDEIGAIDLTPVMHISHFVVDPGHRRRGVGRALLTVLVQTAEESGVDRIMATAAAGSREANRYLARLGFAPLTVHRVAPLPVLRRSLGLSESSDRMAVLRRARARALRTGGGPAARGA